MRVLLFALALIVVATVGFGLGRTSASDGSEADAESTEVEHTGRIGDTFRIPSLGLYCSVGIEAGLPRLLCGHLGLRPRYQVSFERNRTVVIAVGDPGDITVFPERQ